MSVLLVWSLVLTGLQTTSVGQRRKVRDQIDVLGVAAKPTCVAKQAVQSLNRYLQPRRIVIITTNAEACSVFRTFAHNVDCKEENDVLPGVSKDTVGTFLEKRYTVDGDGEFNGRTLAGWYLQQFLKLGASQYLPDLSRYFLIWDMDMILLHKLSPFYPSYSRKLQHVEQKTVVNIGGARNPGYEFAYKQLTGSRLEYAEDGSSFVTHSLVVYKPYMKEFLSSISKGNFTYRVAETASHAIGTITTGSRNLKNGPSTDWVWRILDSLDPQFINIGFSEYASYVSWVKQHHPESQHILSHRTWRRNPIGGLQALSLGRYLHPDGLCCPVSSMLGLMRVLGYQYVGFEIGHNAVCHYNDEQFSTGYGV